MQMKILFVVATSVFLLSACTTPEKPRQPLPEQRTLQLQALNYYQVSGGLGIWTDEQSISARLNWQETPDKLTLQISGPLGIGNMELISQPGAATLSRGGTVVSTGPFVDTVLQAGLGLTAPVPMQQLRLWVRGLPGDANSVVRDAEDKLSSLRFVDEQGVRWQARFLNYADLGGLAVPSLITASGGPYSVRLRLKNWRRSDVAVIPKKTQSNTRLAIPQR